MLSPVEFLGFSSEVVLWQLILLAFISLAVGLLGGFLGLALGTIRLPALLLLGVPLPVAAGTNLLVSISAALAGSASHLRERRVVFQVVAVMGAPSIAGAFIGGFLSNRVSEPLLLALVGVFVLWQGVELHVRSRRRVLAGNSPGEREESPAGLGLTRKRFAIEGVVGLGIGLLGGAVGLILGSLRLPVLINTLGMNPRLAAGTNLVIGLFLGLFGFVGHSIHGEVDVPLLLAMGAAAVVGSAYGARFTGRVSLTMLLRIMAGVLVVVGVLLLWRAAPWT